MLIPRHSIIKKSSNQLFSSRRFDVPNGYSSRCTLSKARAEFGNPCSFPSPPFLLSLSFSLSTPPAYYSRALCFLSFRFRLINSIPLSLSLSRLLGPTHSLIPPFSSSFHLGLLFSYFVLFSPFYDSLFFLDRFFSRLSVRKDTRKRYPTTFFPFLFFSFLFFLSIRASTAFVCFHLHAFVRYSILPRLLSSLFPPFPTQNPARSLFPLPFRLVVSHRHLLFIPNRFRFLSTFISPRLFYRESDDRRCLFAVLHFPRPSSPTTGSSFFIFCPSSISSVNSSHDFPLFTRLYHNFCEFLSFIPPPFFSPCFAAFFRINLYNKPRPSSLPCIIFLHSYFPSPKSSHFSLPKSSNL